MTDFPSNAANWRLGNKTETETETDGLHTAVAYGTLPVYAMVVAMTGTKMADQA
jgi:hypothetical protein